MVPKRRANPKEMNIGPLIGLSAAEAARRLREEGPNSIPSGPRPGIARIALEVLREPMLLLLLAASALYLVIGDLTEALILATSILVVIGISIG
jgi:Ca2+-transporting ATPase